MSSQIIGIQVKPSYLFQKQKSHKYEGLSGQDSKWIITILKIEKS